MAQTMAGEPLFDLELLGYRNDLARERVLSLLRGLPEIAPHVQDSQPKCDFDCFNGSCVRSVPAS